MNYQALLNSLKRKVVSPLYLFWGEETLLRDQILAQFKSKLIPSEVRDFNMDILDGKNTNPDEIVTLASTLPFMSDKRVVIVENAEYFKAKKKAGSEKDEKQKKTEEVLVEYFKQPLESTCLIFTTDSIDRKKKTYKAIQEGGTVVEFSPLKNLELNNWLETRAAQLGKKLEPAAMAELVTAVGNNLRVLDSEVQKLASYIGERIDIKGEDVVELVSKTAELSIFEMMDAIGERKYEKAIRTMRELVLYGEPPVKILVMVARHFRIMLQINSLQKAGLAEKEIASQLQLHPYVAQKSVRQARNFSRKELEPALGRILETDLAIKTGQMEPVMALELLFVRLCAREEG